MIHDRFSFLSLYDGTCDQTKELKTLTGMKNDKWVISSSGRNMFVNFLVELIAPDYGFSAEIHFGNKNK